MADRGIIFSAPMVRALLDGRKTMTRRVLKLSGRAPDFIGGRGQEADPSCWGWDDDSGSYILAERGAGDNGFLSWRDMAQAYAPGDRLYVREHWRTARAYDDLAPSEMGGEEPVRYEADASWQTWGWGAPLRCHGRFRQGTHMPRWASRLTLIVTDVRVQQLQEISEADAVAEGCDPVHMAPGGRYGDPSAGWLDYRDGFRGLWNRLHGPKAWDANPWVCALTFSAHRCNIDQMPGVRDG